MSDEKKKDLARRAVACPGWRWMSGMRVSIEYDSATAMARIVSVSADGFAAVDERGYEHGWYHVGLGPARDRCLPDLDDPATLGCLLALVREAWPLAPATTARCVGVSSNAHRWMCSVPTPCSYASNGPPEWRALFGDTEAEALVAALEARSSW
jgi:hypothetical protein